VKVIPVDPAFNKVSVNPLAVAIVGSLTVTDQAPGELVTGGVSTTLLESKATVIGERTPTIVVAACAGCDGRIKAAASEVAIHNFFIVKVFLSSL
jgi:hypothetical protein